MEFMGVAVGILALICALVLLFGRSGTRKILGWGIATAVAVGAAIAFYFWADSHNWRPSTTVVSLAVTYTLILLIGRSNARQLVGWGVIAAVAVCTAIALYNLAESKNQQSVAAPTYAPAPQPAPNNAATVQRYLPGVVPNGWEFDPVTGVARPARE
jgi:hypothetical protein